jgi:predicted dehydrogenase
MPHILSHDSVDEAIIVERSFVNRFIARRLTRCRVFKDLEDVDLASIDVGVILTPSASHFALAKKILNAGIHCFVEKPMTVSSAESAELCRLATQKDVVLQVGYVYRWNPVFQYVKSLLEKGELGEPRSASLRMRGNVVGPTSKKSWRSSGQGSGCLFDFGSHIVDLAVYLFGPFQSVDKVEGESAYTEGGVDRFCATLHRHAGQPESVLVSADWSDQTARKAIVELFIELDEGKVEATPQMIRISRSGLKEEISISNLNTDVSYYLRGEDFAAQWDCFFDLISRKAECISRLSRPDETVDRLLEMIAGEIG